MTTLTLHIQCTSKEPGTPTAFDATLVDINNAMPTIGTLLPSPPWDSGTYITQKNNISNFNNFYINEATFKCPVFGTVTTNSDGCTFTSADFIVADMESVPGLTPENAFDVFKTTEFSEAQSHDLDQWVKFKQVWMYDVYFNTVTSVTTA